MPWNLLLPKANLTKMRAEQHEKARMAAKEHSTLPTPSKLCAIAVMQSLIDLVSMGGEEETEKHYKRRVGQSSCSVLLL